ncbi:pentapeptide repeat-containing protein [Pseudomonas agarici]|nr:pentapeptide repeat-containing protein [Pseudomonas agarici]
MNNRIESKILSGLEQDGLVLLEKTFFKSESIQTCKLRNSKLSYPIFDGCLLENCVFEKSDFSNSRFFNVTILNLCDFKNVDFRSAGLNNSVFDSCTFVKCDFRKTAFNECTFNNCIFDQCKIINNTFNAKKIKNCKLIGKIQEITFTSEQPNTLLRIDFGRCELDYVNFENCNLEEIVPPVDTQHIYFKDLSDRAKKALSYLMTQPDSSINILLKRRLKNFSTQRGWIFNIKNLETIEGQEYSKRIISLLTDMK